MSINLSAFAGAGAQFFDDNGDPLSGGLLYVYDAGTTTPVNTFTSKSGTTLNTNPIVLDAAGRTPNEIWLTGGVLYKFRLRDSDGVLIGDYDNIPAIDDPTGVNNLISVSGTNTLIGTSPSPIIAYSAGQLSSFIAANTSTGPVTIDIDGLGAKDICYDSSVVLAPGGIQAGKITTIEYDGTLFQLTNTMTPGQIVPDPRVNVASAGTVNLSTGALNSRNINITGTTAITDFTVASGLVFFVRFDGALTLTNNSSIVTNTGSNIFTAAGDTCIIRSTATNTVEVLSYSRASQTILRGYIDGLTLSTAGSSATMSISAGQATDSTNSVLISLSSSIAKTTSAWALGTAQGGLDTGTIANSTWYYFYLIRRPDTGVVDLVFSANSTSPTLPANYTQFRYIGAGLTNGSAQWTRFVQNGDYFEWYDPFLDVDATTNTTAALSTLTVPRGRKMLAKFNLYVSDGTNGAGRIYISDPDVLDEPVSSSVSPLATIIYNGAASDFSAIQAECWTNTSAQVRRVGQNATNFCRLATLGWVDQRGRNA